MASGDPVGFAYLAVPASSNAPTRDLTAAPYPVYDYDDATSETMYFLVRMLGTYNGTSSIKVIAPWKFSTFVGSQTCAWEISFYRIADDADSIESYTFATAQTSTPTEASLTGEVDYLSITFTNAQADGIQPSEYGVIRVVRNAAGGTASPGDAELGWPVIELA